MKELVRCKDCKFKYCPNTLEMYKVPDDQLWCSEVDTNPDDYCSMGERREKAETVEAIPVEWIRQWVEENYELECDYAIEQMLDDWEEEKGTK